MPVNPDGRPCRCGSVGCWETEVGEGALLARAGYPADGGRAAVEALLRDAEAGSSRRPRAPSTTSDAGSASGSPGWSTSSTRGWSSSAACSRGSTRSSREARGLELDRYALPASRRLVRVVPSTLGVDAPLVGAAELAFEPLLADPAACLGRRDQPRFTWRAPDVGARVPVTRKARNRPRTTATGMKGASLTM